MNHYIVTLERRGLDNMIRIRHITVRAVNETQAIRKARYQVGMNTKLVYDPRVIPHECSYCEQGLSFYCGRTI